VPSSFQSHPDHIYRVAEFEQFEWLEHGFSTRHTLLGPDSSRLATAKQIHSATVLTVSDSPGVAGAGDALITNQTGRLVGVRTADCVPILLADVKNRAVAAVHAGWRGTVKGISLWTISEMVARFGTTAGDLWAAVGPAIRGCCYEVGGDVARQFVRWWPEFGDTDGAVKLDLVETNRRQLLQAGVEESRIIAEAPCTFCTAQEFHSYRRDAERAGRMVAWIGIRG
jgi:polyphenol oxidase